MHLKTIIFSLILTELAIKCFVKGLQCYVCEDCNEYEDFKELHICGEIPNDTLIKPFTVSTATNEPTTKTAVESFSKPTANPSIDDYLFEDSGEIKDAPNSQNSSQKEITEATVTKTTTNTRITIQKPASVAASSLTETSTLMAEEPTIEQTGTTQTNSQQKVSQVFISEGKTTSSNSAAVTTTKPEPTIGTDYDDYIEYEDPMKTDGRSAKSLLKYNQPVCYMIKYHANNTVFTNRGCTTFINDNKYLTCQSLNNGASMELCRICSSNGCNKYVDDDGNDECHESFFNTAGTLEHFGILMLTLLVLFSYKTI